MREATALTAKWANGRWVVTSASTSVVGLSLSTVRAAVTLVLSAPWRRLGTGIGTFLCALGPSRLHHDRRRADGTPTSGGVPAALADRTRRRKGGRHGPPAPVDVALARAGTARPPAL